MENQWLMSGSHLASTSLRGIFQIFNPETVDRLFGPMKGKKAFVVYRIKNTKSAGAGQVQFSVDLAVYKDLAGVHQFIHDEKLNRVWIYVPDFDYILYYEGAKFVCVDYEHFKEGDTPIIEIGNLKAPLTDFKEFKEVLSVARTFMLEVAELRKAALGNSAICNQCFKEFEGKAPLSCAACNLAFYCDRACQGKHLPFHKRSCQKVKNIREEENVLLVALEGPKKDEVLGTARLVRKEGVDPNETPTVFNMDIE